MGVATTSPKRQKKRPVPEAAAGESVEYFEVYAEHSRTLRTWLAAYGIGGPVLLVSNATAWSALGRSGQAGIICWLFMVGVAAQVFLTAVNKAAMWAIYYGELDPEFTKRWSYRASDWWSERLWIDVLVDWASIVLFALATVFAFRVLTRS
jgi:hypothetical protein